MAKYVNKRFMLGGFYFHIGIVDLFVRGGTPEGKTIYPIISLDLLKSEGMIGLVFTLPVIALTVGHVK